MIPEPIMRCLVTHFCFPKERLFAQVANIDGTMPDVRTMAMYEPTHDGKLIFLTDTRSRKWASLQANPGFAACFFNGIDRQIIVHGVAELITFREDPKILESYWPHIDDDVKRVYGLDHTKEASVSHHVPDIPHDVPPNFGVIKLNPQKWELLEIDINTYARSCRRRFERQEESWKVIELNPL